VTVHDSLARRLGTKDAVVVGLGSMIGAGVFSAFAPAAAAAGSGLLVGLALAAGVAYCNAVASAQLAAQYPTSGGTYVYGRERLGEWWGFVAGWGFVIGKTASCAAMALTFASYAVGGSMWEQRAVAAAAVGVLTAVNYRGITRTAGLARVLVAASVLALVVVVGAIAAAGGLDAGTVPDLPFGDGGVYGIVQSAGLLFFAFAGYARIATLGEEVRDPQRTIPRAIPIALGIAVLIYAAVGVSLLLAAGPAALAASTAPVITALDHAGAAWADPIARAGAAVASLGALLALIAGIGRTALAMARNRDLPQWLASVHPRYRVPDHAELALGIVVVLLVLTTDLRGAIGFSSFGVLVYYAVANASAYTQSADHRRWPRVLNAVGLVACVALVVALPWRSVVAGAAVLVVGLAGRALVTRRSEPGSGREPGS
jgi:APA family basic amino acid/polyamine antiporter